MHAWSSLFLSHVYILYIIIIYNNIIIHVHISYSLINSYTQYLYDIVHISTYKDNPQESPTLNDVFIFLTGCSEIPPSVGVRRCDAQDSFH